MLSSLRESLILRSESSSLGSVMRLEVSEIAKNWKDLLAVGDSIVA